MDAAASHAAALQDTDFFPGIAVCVCAIQIGSPADRIWGKYYADRDIWSSLQTWGMRGNLAIMVPHIGAASETFIRRHMEDLLPGRTAVVARYEADRSAGYWSVQSPSLVLDKLPATFGSRLRRVSRKFGLPAASYEMAAAARFVKSQGVTVILAEWLDLGLPWFDFARRLGLRFFVHAHGYDVSARQLADPKWSREYLCYNDADGIISMSALGRERLIALGLQPNKVHAIPYGVDVPSTMPSRAPGEVVRCVAVGRMVAKKAPILLLDAFRRAAERCPQLRLDYLGGGPLSPAASQFVRTFGLEGRVCLHGTQPSDRVKELLLGADIFLQHSVTDPETGDEEGLPVAILEAMAAGLPVVSTRHAGIPEAVADGESGLLVEEGDSAGMSERVVRLAQDQALRAQLGQAGWRRVRDKFSWDQERRALLGILGLAAPAVEDIPSSDQSVMGKGASGQIDPLGSNPGSGQDAGAFRLRPVVGPVSLEGGCVAPAAGRPFSATAKPAHSAEYRPDIDGLRAIAVLAVVAFHTTSKLRGGYFGVDVFFVISGFLISRLILQDLDQKQFSIRKFYVRRIRRIFPALIVVLACVWAAGWLFLFPVHPGSVYQIHRNGV